ncbi:MAG: hypothetical protein K6E58_04245 [Eubacterium sp.]|nr:hypothetical protein [Eubacterium sp.]
MDPVKLEELRKEVIAEVSGMAFGPFPFMGGMAIEAQTADEARLIEMARELHIDVEKYMN